MPQPAGPAAHNFYQISQPAAGGRPSRAEPARANSICVIAQPGARARLLDFVAPNEQVEHLKVSRFLSFALWRRISSGEMGPERARDGSSAAAAAEFCRQQKEKKKEKKAKFLRQV